jgi:hypothetical protein
MTRPAQALLALMAITLLCRGWQFGNPLVNIDEQFYLFIGDRMLQGELPYVDIWDRKPLGLFLIYALAAALPNPVLVYQLLASLAVLATAWLIFTAARRYASFPSALAAAVAYPPWLNVFGGIGGQSPVFYNLPMLIAGLWVLKAWLRDDRGQLTRRGCGVMLLVGIAIQIKYTAVFEGIFFGLTLLLASWRSQRPLGRIVCDAAFWITCALLPTAAAWGWFAAMGYNDAFVQANFLSVLADDNAMLPALGRLAGLLFGLTPLAICAWFAWGDSKLEDSSGRTLRWLFAWTAASLAGFLLFGNWNDHYTLPLLVPLCLLIAAGFDRIAKPRLAMALVIGLGMLGGGGRAYVEWQITGNAAQAQRLLVIVNPHLGSGCLYVNEDLPYLYRLTNSCLPTRFTFPPHLAYGRYAKVLGVDQMGELDRVLASRPSVIVMSTIPAEDTRWARRDAVEAVLKVHYRKVGSEVIGQTPFEVYTLSESMAARAAASRSAQSPAIR